MTGKPPQTRNVPDLSLVRIGTAGTSWTKGDCPKNMREARERGTPATITIDPPYRAALAGLDRASHVVLLGWFERAARDRLVQHPKHVARPLGAFALRSPDRPNPIAVSVAKLLSVDVATGRVAVDALDWLDGTPVLDIKPYYASADSVPDATVSD